MAGSMCFEARKKSGQERGGLVAEAYQRLKYKTYPMMTKADLTCKPKSKTAQVAGGGESDTARAHTNSEQPQQRGSTTGQKNEGGTVRERGVHWGTGLWCR